MAGGAAVRFCASCQKQVHNLSSVAEARAQALMLVFASAGMCVRFEVDAHGEAVHAADVPRLRPRPATTPAAGLVAAAALVAVGCGGAPGAAAGGAGAAKAMPAAAPSGGGGVATASPPAVDADRDGVNDDVDACPNDPGMADGCPVRVVVQEVLGVMVTPSVAFSPGSSKPPHDFARVADEVADVLLTHRELLQVAVEGHASAGEPNARKLSQDRARAVVRGLIKRGVDPARLVAEGYGVDRPIDTNDTQLGRARNRRVEFRIVDKAGGPATPPVP